MTNITITPVVPATHADGLAIFDGVLGALSAAGWTRLRVDSFVHPDADPLPDGKRWVVRHHFSAGVWTLTFQPDPNQHGDTGRDRRQALIDRRRDLPSIRAVLSQLFGPHIGLARPPASANGKDET